MHIVLDYYPWLLDTSRVQIMQSNAYCVRLVDTGIVKIWIYELLDPNIYIELNISYW